MMNRLKWGMVFDWFLVAGIGFLLGVIVSFLLLGLGG